MPQTPKTEVKTKSRTSQITGVIVAVVAAIGIGALIYFAVVNYNTEITKETTLPVFEQEYQPNVELVSPTVTDQTQIADIQTKLDAIASSVTSVIEKQAQDSSITIAQVVDSTQADAMIKSISDKIVVETTTDIKTEVDNLIGKNELDSSQAQTAEDYAMIQLYGDLTKSTGGIDSSSLFNTLTDVQKSDLNTATIAILTSLTQKIETSSSTITKETSGNESTINTDLTAEVVRLFGQATNSTLDGTKAESIAANSEISAAPNTWACTPEGSCTHTTNCEQEYGVGNCYASEDDCKKSKLCAQPASQPAYCVNNACTTELPVAVCVPPNCPISYDNIQLCIDSNCAQVPPEEAIKVPTTDYLLYFCAENGCTKETFPAESPEAAKILCENGGTRTCYDQTEDGILACTKDCIKPEEQKYSYCDTTTNQCNQVVNSNECIDIGAQGTKKCVPSGTQCCQANVIPTPPTEYYYCDKNDKTNGCKQSEGFNQPLEVERLAACEVKYGVGNCQTGKKVACDETCKEDPVLDEITNQCNVNLPNDPNCPLQVIDKIENKPVSEITEYKLSVTSSIIYRGLGRSIMKFWANPNDPVNFAYTKQKLANDFKDNKLRVRFGDKKDDLSDVLKVYRDPRNPEKFYAIAYKLNIDNLWQNDEGNYKSKQYFYQVSSDNKKSDFFDFQSLQRGGEVLYVKNRLYNGNYDLKKYGTIELNLKNSGQLANDLKKLNDKFKNFENGGVNFWSQSSKVSPYGLRTAMAGDQRFKQFYGILKNLQKKNDITKAVQVLYNYHDRLIPTNIYKRYDLTGVDYWVKQVNNGNLSFTSMTTYVLLGTDEPKENLEQFWGSGKIAIRKAEIELSFVKALSRGITQLSDIDRFMNASKYVSSASIRADLRNSDEFRRLLNDVYKRNGASDAISLLYIAVLGRPIDPDGQPFYVNKFDKLRSEGLNATDALNEIDKELTNSAEYKDAIARPIK